MSNYFDLKSFLPTNSTKIYLCVKLHENDKNYNCIKFDTYNEADIYYNSCYKDTKVEYSTMLPVCKYIPEYFHPSILNYKLSKIFINASIHPKS